MPREDTALELQLDGGSVGAQWVSRRSRANDEGVTVINDCTDGLQWGRIRDWPRGRYLSCRIRSRGTEVLTTCLNYSKTRIQQMCQGTESVGTRVITISQWPSKPIETPRTSFCSQSPSAMKRLDGTAGGLRTLLGLVFTARDKAK
ncbi:hypothetical protein LIA77_08290 [Sarocladium implicatum]|nr:hypothetical protein LIA77_08290 [Sarocladium implicatum]